MQLYESCCRCAVGLTITLDCQLVCDLACDASSLVCSLLSWVLLWVAKGHTHLTHPPPCVRTSHSPSLTHCNSHTLALYRVILLAFVQHHDQGITLRPIAGTHTPNSLRSNWDFLLGRYPWHVGGSNTVNKLKTPYKLRMPVQQRTLCAPRIVSEFRCLFPMRQVFW